jgi:hypothetical protein
VSRGRKQSRDTQDVSEIFADVDFDADEFVEHMEDKTDRGAGFGTGWRRLEVLREERLLRRELSDYEDWDDLGA